MNKLFFIAVVLSSIFSFSQDFPAYQIFTKEGKKANFSKLSKAVLTHKFVFFGELHNNPIAHWLQYELLVKLHQKHREKLICGSEMYEQDNQDAINKYLKGTFSSKQFKDSCRLWSNQETDYQSMLDFAKENKIQWIATNIPRKYASLVYKKSILALDSLSEKEKSWIAPLPMVLDTNLSQYAALMNGNLHMGNNFVYAQAIKDATMAHFISQSLKENSVFYHLNGSYHSDYFQGIMWYLNHYTKTPYKEMLSISTVSQKDISKLESEYFGKADFIICVPENMTTTH
jgi:uncharacterized iron-regulated protein